MPNKIKEITINKKAITPMVDVTDTQIIFQRHCEYSKNENKLLESSVKEAKGLMDEFIKKLDKFNPYLIGNTYFLFTASNTLSKENFKRCVATTNIALNKIKDYLIKNDIPLNHIINLDKNTNYLNNIHESNYLTEPKMFTDNTGYIEYLKEKNGGINKNFWIDFEEDLLKFKRLELGSEGPDEIVKRASLYINILKRYAHYFHKTHKNSRLIIWNGTHYDLISPLAKQSILSYEKRDIVNVEYLGGISLFIDENDYLVANLNNTIYEFDFQYKKQPHQRF